MLPAASRGGCEVARTGPLSGFPELLPAARVVEREVVASLSRTFELHGFANIETRAVEPVEVLLGKGETSNCPIGQEGWDSKRGGPDLQLPIRARGVGAPSARRRAGPEHAS